ncbi:MAG: tetratricopeptide repeat protein [Acidobacteriota bacterium]
MTRISVLAALGLCTSLGIARADEATAKQRYEDGEHAYNLGQFQKAIDLFTQAYEQWPEPAFLFNIAQAYRQAGDCKQAMFFYKRFLALKANDTKRPIKPAIKDEVEGRITELEDCVKREIASKPPDTLDNGSGQMTTTTPPRPPGPTTKPATTTATAAPQPVATATDKQDDDDDDDGETRVVKRGGYQPRLISARVTGGAAKLSAGGLDTPMQPAFAAFVGYPLALAPRLELDLGPMVTFTPVPYGTTSNGDGTASLFAVAADAGIAYTVIPKLAVRGDVGVGVQLMSGLEKDGNPFTTDGSAATGALSTFFTRIAASADYAVTQNLVVTATPIAFSYAPAPTGFLSTISSLTTLSFLVGVGYRQ